MEKHVLKEELISAYCRKMQEEEKAVATLEKYQRDIMAFWFFMPDDKIVNKETVQAYKRHISETHKAASVNSMLVALNRFFEFLGWTECKVRLVRIQRRIFRDPAREMTKEEYLRLCKTAHEQNKVRLCLLLQAICATGIRVSEHSFLTVEAVKHGYAAVSCKGKTRTVFLPKKLQKELLSYCIKEKIASGPVFVTRTGRPLDRRNIWTEMKQLCEAADVLPDKVFPHNLRHLFAVTYYRLKKDIVRLADILGHASIDTTRIYTSTSWQEHVHQLSQLRLVI